MTVTYSRYDRKVMGHGSVCPKHEPLVCEDSGHNGRSQLNRSWRTEQNKERYNAKNAHNWAFFVTRMCLTFASGGAIIVNEMHKSAISHIATTHWGTMKLLSKLVPSSKALYWFAFWALVVICGVIYYQCAKNQVVLDMLKQWSCVTTQGVPYGTPLFFAEIVWFCYCLLTVTWRNWYTRTSQKRIP